MTSDVRIALERFQNFVSRFSHSGMIDPVTGFTTGDAALLIGEINCRYADIARPR